MYVVDCRGLKIATGRGDRVGTWTRDRKPTHSHATIPTDVEKRCDAGVLDGCTDSMEEKNGER
jgi:hypothetical protein